MSITRRIRRRRPRPDCREIAALMQAFLDGELDERATERVAAHLEDCHRCGIDAAVYADVKASLAAIRPAPDTAAIDRLRGFADGLAADRR